MTALTLLAAALADDACPLKAITVWQPWASLIARGVKTIETRPRRCSHRGFVAIHAATAIPADVRRDVLNQRQRGYLHSHLGGDTRILNALYDLGYSEGGCGDGRPLPRGANVAVADLTDCLPIIEGQFTDHGHERFLLRAVGGLGREVLRLAERAPRPGPGVHSYDIGSGSALTDDFTDELPFGDYSTGRHGLIFAEVVPLPEPVPCRGQQTVPWRVPDDVTERVWAQFAEAQDTTEPNPERTTS